MKIHYQKYTFYIKAIEPLYLPYYKGSTFRGGFGNAFRKVACPLRVINCDKCLLKQKCIYAYVFETPPPEGSTILNMNKYEKIPHPFVIEPPEWRQQYFPEGQTLSFNLILIGSAIDYIPYFIYTFEQLGEIGIGKGRGKYVLSEVKIDGITVYKKGILKKSISKIMEIPSKFENTDSVENLTLKIITPLRIRYQRKFVTELDFHILVRNLIRRISLLGYFHCGEQLPDFTVQEVIRHAETINTVNSNLRWHDWERYSSRQETKMKLGGVIGEIVYRGNIAPFIPYLKAGEILHVGKNTSFGLGKYEIILDKA
ncbi:CRISPR system precrRNA processing endoribonuclease RAMP protein Cas6 [Thermodesulfovibrio yellowstonii]|uniref:CRISPR system precrRNA processing endoribonuclease RAMP protein Cas6 n=1 Tax=Thermodesulfovibrio yellowstonii TaxID=28262 RepID=UPI0024B3B450|nr:CRISPR system precrRNA processing endoribonuclease RAMP protein Cas6 [Thermodesulfovibrio yellowstonii]MDI6865489.1 CRISPR system precrRNA processing endoribonuclease RAMP protein Cas6 [Thermodesulfovibrio yellowstonii]